MKLCDLDPRHTIVIAENRLFVDSLNSTVLHEVQIPSKLKNLAAAGTIGLASLGGALPASAQSTGANHSTISQDADDGEQMRPQARPSHIELDNQQLRPQARPTDIYIVNNDLERNFVGYLQRHGFSGNELVAFLAQAYVETGGFDHLAEVGSRNYFNDRYGPHTRAGRRLGNTEADDGYNFRGRGYVHLTGRYNYNLLTERSGVDFVSNPDLAAEPTIAMGIAVWYWKLRVRPNVTDFENVESVTRYITGGSSALAQREEIFKQYQQRLRFMNEIDEQHRLA